MACITELVYLWNNIFCSDHDRAVKKADELRQRYRTDSNLLYRLTCIYSLSIPEVGQARQAKGLTPENKALQASYRDKA